MVAALFWFGLNLVYLLCSSQVCDLCQNPPLPDPSPVPVAGQPASLWRSLRYLEKGKRTEGKREKETKESHEEKPKPYKRKESSRTPLSQSQPYPKEKPVLRKKEIRKPKRNPPLLSYAPIQDPFLDLSYVHLSQEGEDCFGVGVVP